MSLSVTELTFGYSQSGSSEYLSDLNAKAIIETKAQLKRIDGIVTAVEQNWQGQAALNFITNLNNAVVGVSDMLDLCSAALTAEMQNIHNAMVEQDNQMVPIEE